MTAAEITRAEIFQTEASKSPVVGCTFSFLSSSTDRPADFTSALKLRLFFVIGNRFVVTVRHRNHISQINRNFSGLLGPAYLNVSLVNKSDTERSTVNFSSVNFRFLMLISQSF